MRRAAVLLLLAGAVLLLLAPLAGAAYERVAVIPEDVAARVLVATPPGEDAAYFDVSALRQRSGPLATVVEVRVDGLATRSARAQLGRDVLVLRTSSCTDRAGVDCRRLRYPLTASVTTGAVDRVTGEYVPWSGAAVESGGTRTTGVDLAGASVKLPFDAQRRDYPMWNGDVRRAVDARFAGTADVHGVAVHRYVQQVPATTVGTVEVPGSLVGSRAAAVRAERVVATTAELLVEPETGVVLGTDVRIDAWLALDGRRALTLARGRFATDDAALAAAADRYRTAALALRLLRAVVPPAALAAGAAAALLGAALLVRSRRAVPAASSAAPNGLSEGPEPAAAEA